MAERDRSELPQLAVRSRAGGGSGGLQNFIHAVCVCGALQRRVETFSPYKYETNTWASIITPRLALPVNTTNALLAQKTGIDPKQCQRYF